MARGRTPRGAATRERLLQAAAAQLADRGYHATKVSDIVTAAGLTQNAFYFYFPSKEAIRDELVTRFQDRLGQLVAAGQMEPTQHLTAVRERARQNLCALFRFLAADPDLTRVALYISPAAEDLKRSALAMVAANLRISQSAGYVAPRIDVETAAECLLGIVDRLTLHRLLPGLQEPDDLARQVAHYSSAGCWPATRANDDVERWRRKVNPLISLLRTIGYLLTGRLRFVRDHVGREMTMKDGQRFVVFRHAMVDPGEGVPRQPGGTFVVRFHVARMTVQQNIRFSLIPIPFFVGMHGFRSKLWLYSPETGDFQGIYEWQTAQDARNYARSIALRFMTRRSVPGSVTYEILPTDRATAFSL